MANVKTIKPLGGGDFTTLAAWNVYAAAQATADQWAECYSGGNLGAVNLSSWASVPSTMAYPRIYAEPGSRHDGTVPGTTGTNGAFILVTGSAKAVDVSIPYVEIDGLIHNKDSSGAGLVRFNAGGHDYTFINNLVRHGGGAATTTFQDFSSAPEVRNYLANNVFYNGPATVAGGTTLTIVGDGDGSGGPLYCVNNTFLNGLKNGTVLEVACLSPNSVIINNFIYGVDVGGGTSIGVVDDSDGGGGEHFAVYYYNAVQDGSSSFYGDIFFPYPDGPLTDYITSSTDPSLPAGSPLIDTGYYTPFDWLFPVTDIIGTTRPQGPHYDVGVFEFIQGSGIHRHGQFRGIIGSGLY